MEHTSDRAYDIFRSFSSSQEDISAALSCRMTRTLPFCFEHCMFNELSEFFVDFGLCNTLAFAMADSIDLPFADDFHVHLRQGDMMHAVVTAL